MKSVIIASKTVIPNIQQLTHNLAALCKGNTACTSTKGEENNLLNLIWANS